MTRNSRLLSFHLSWVLLFTLGVYVFRDVVPLFVKYRSPADSPDGIILWVKLLVLFEAAVAIPLVAPRVYEPHDPDEPMEHPNKNQTASVLSSILFNWINETISKASRVSHFPLDDLPVLADTYTTTNLIKESFPHVDPFQLGKDEHLFWGLLRVYRRKYLIYSALVFISSILALSRPIAVKGLLASIEVGGQKSDVYPWAWIVLLFVGPTLVTLQEEWAQWMMNRLNIRNDAIVTELLFEHALRIRVKSETSRSADEPQEGGNAGNASEKQGNLVGRLNNLVASDLENVRQGNKMWLQLFVKVPILIVANISFVYGVLGYSALIGLASIIALLPVPGYLSKRIQRYQIEKMNKTDSRVQLISEILNVIRMIKLFGWEPRVAGQVKARREAELKLLRKSRFVELVNNCSNFSIPLFTMAITFGAYTTFQHGVLTAPRLFSSYTAFMTIQQQLHLIFFAIPVVTQAKVSLDRLNAFLHDTELLDQYEEIKHGTVHREQIRHLREPDIIGIKQTAFKWASDRKAQTTVTPSGTRQREFVLNIDEELLFKRGQINLVVGPTGSGKTSLLMALLGEMHAIPAGPESFVALPRAGGVAYAAQESWIQSETIRENILFGAPYDEKRYNKVIKQCALERDLTLFDAGDKTEVGEKGIALSGGQKARITLARAVYSSAEILILDDVLAALDVHTSRWIVDKCFKGDLIRGRTVILVSHNVALIRPIANFLVALGSDGRVVSQGSLDEALQKDRELLEELKTEEALHQADTELERPNIDGHDTSDGKLVIAEEISEGRVGWNAFLLYTRNTSTHNWPYWTFYIATLCMTHALINGESYFLGYWAAQYEDHDPSEVPVPFYMSIYFGIITAILFIYAVCWSTYVYGSIRASRNIHSDLVATILGTTLRWLDMTPTSRIVARCTADIQAVDTNIPSTLHYVLEGTVFMLSRIAAVMLITPMFILPAFVVSVIAGWVSQIYMRAQLSVKREMSNARAPVLAHFGSAIAGIISVRAYGAQETFKSESCLRMDRYNRAGFVQDALSRWINIRLDVLGNSLSTVLAAYLVYVAHISSSGAGFAMSMAVGFSGFILAWLRTLNDFQVMGNSLERIQQYMTIEQEPKSSITGVPPAYWPASGDLRVEKLSARYSPDGPRVLHELSFEVKSGERIGIVGRTGSGKSSLTLSLLRCIPTEGAVYYDGRPTDTLNLEALRSHITIIPQMPELLSRTLRQNLDPFEQHDDATLNDALRSAGLFSLQEEGDHGRITLDDDIAGGGGNLSVGQRQIIALARAIVRRSKLLILDEATSAIDYETDSIIQKSLREELGRDVTVLTVAHRLQSIMDSDKIMVLDAGRLVEYDAPSALLERQDGYFRSLVDGSSDRTALYAMAGVSL
ncbi:P-loop containing nucleoside triphosphate hydrolase protein [Dichomitus squalens LYAD-421 SS1]|uniref:P-loop containing nucleoside triphosphate hydrolase protein n=1 Tax=Dichomitus squalens (strain LYAD-421) TaxID=732165 RepID=R7T075_DICSQ|nr:P-loop containing nucleoside triphosphate hydrolase protein [Dichomitus squalens LYAD-421 SS1]EJF61844.1 P-loop containing nucleoside triphosphate hydrolase protein [Dichomitus squalens LYAD-421 SS1]